MRQFRNYRVATQMKRWHENTPISVTRHALIMCRPNSEFTSYILPQLGFPYLMVCHIILPGNRVHRPGTMTTTFPCACPSADIHCIIPWTGHQNISLIQTTTHPFSLKTSKPAPDAIQFSSAAFVEMNQRCSLMHFFGLAINVLFFLHLKHRINLPWSFLCFQMSLDFTAVEM